MPTPSDTTTPQLLVLHRVQGMWSAIAATPQTDGMALNSCIRLQDSALEPWIAQQNAASIRVVLPAGSAVCRTIHLGEEANDAPLQQRLMAEVAGGSSA